MSDHLGKCQNKYLCPSILYLCSVICVVYHREHSLCLSCCSLLLLGHIVLLTDSPWLPPPLKKAVETPATSPAHLQDNAPKIQTDLLQLSI